ncbi:MAG: DUF2997 domain-containing protein [bacterium]|nr:DUF2997 domain-containing protein [bacterium]
MSQRFIIKVSPDGSTEVRTEGFTGSQCRQASEFLERSLGSRQSEQLTAEFFNATVAKNPAHIQQGDSTCP